VLARKYGVIGWLGVGWPWTLNFGTSTPVLHHIVTKGRTAKIGLMIAFEG
jgi:hypothetical protein